MANSGNTDENLTRLKKRILRHVEACPEDYLVNNKGNGKETRKKLLEK
jgi:hypothetical protein